MGSNFDHRGRWSPGRTPRFIKKRQTCGRGRGGRALPTGPSSARPPRQGHWQARSRCPRLSNPGQTRARRRSQANHPITDQRRRPAASGCRGGRAAYRRRSPGRRRQAERPRRREEADGQRDDNRIGRDVIEEQGDQLAREGPHAERHCAHESDAQTHAVQPARAIPASSPRPSARPTRTVAACPRPSGTMKVSAAS